MIRSRVVFSAALFACLFGSLLWAQTKTVIDARGKQHIPSPYGEGEGWSAGDDPDTTLEAAFTIDDPNPVPGARVNYQLVITNTGTNATKLPRALDWKDIDDGTLNQWYTRGNVTLELKSKDITTFLPVSLVLYSTDDKPSTALVLKPGDSLRLRGTVTLPTTAFSENWTGTATLLGHFCLSSIAVQAPPAGSRHQGPSTMTSGMWCVNADQKYELTYPAAP